MEKVSHPTLARKPSFMSDFVLCKVQFRRKIEILKILCTYNKLKFYFVVLESTIAEYCLSRKSGKLSIKRRNDYFFHYKYEGQFFFSVMTPVMTLILEGKDKWCTFISVHKPFTNKKTRNREACSGIWPIRYIYPLTVSQDLILIPHNPALCLVVI